MAPGLGLKFKDRFRESSMQVSIYCISQSGERKCGKLLLSHIHLITVPTQEARHPTSLYKHTDLVTVLTQETHQTMNAGQAHRHGYSASTGNTAPSESAAILGKMYFIGLGI